MSTDYSPIDCGLHDELQLLALRRREVALQVRAPGAPEGADTQAVEGRIVDVFTRDGAEYLRLAGGRECRLDRVVSVDGRPFTP